MMAVGLTGAEKLLFQGMFYGKEKPTNGVIPKNK